MQGLGAVGTLAASAGLYRWFNPVRKMDLETAAIEGQTATITFSTSGRMIDVETTSTILEAAEQAGVSLPWECRSGICGQCKVRCTTGRVRMDSRDALSKAEEAVGYLLACQSHPIDPTVAIEA